MDDKTMRELLRDVVALREDMLGDKELDAVRDLLEELDRLRHTLILALKALQDLDKQIEEERNKS